MAKEYKDLVVGLDIGTSKVMAVETSTLKPDCTMATPVIKPQAQMPGATEKISRMPSLKAGCL